MGFLSGLFHSRDKPTNSTNGSAYRFLFGGSNSGKAVNERSAMQMTAVYARVRILSESIAGLPVHIYKYTDSSSKEKAIKHPLYRLIHDEPNPEMTSFVFRETLMTHLLLYGNAYAQIIRNGKGEVIALYPLMANRMSVDRDDKGHLYYQYQMQDSDAPTMKNGTVILKPSDVLHIPGLGFDGLVGYSPIAMAKNAIGLANYTPYGYDWDGENMIINPVQAAVVKRIFADILSGKSTNAIADELNAEKIPSKKNTNWTSSTIRGILANEKYTGDVIFQKTYTDENFNRHTNYGEVDQYMASDHHEAIISHADFDAANALVSQRALEKGVKKGSNKYQKRYAFSGKIICGECGDIFKRRIHTCTTYKYVAWAYNTHLKDKSTCHMKYVRDDDIKAAFVTMLNKLIYGHRLILAPYLKALENSSGDEAIQRIQHLELLLDQNSEQRETLTKLMAQGYIDQILYNQETNALLLQAETYRSDIEAITICMTGDSAKVTETNLLLHFVFHADMLTNYSEELFESYADHIEISGRNKIRFVMKCGLTFTERIGD